MGTHFESIYVRDIVAGDVQMHASGGDYGRYPRHIIDAEMEGVATWRTFITNGRPVSLEEWEQLKQVSDSLVHTLRGQESTEVRFLPHEGSNRGKEVRVVWQADSTIVVQRFMIVELEP